MKFWHRTQIALWSLLVTAGMATMALAGGDVEQKNGGPACGAASDCCGGPNCGCGHCGLRGLRCHDCGGAADCCKVCRLVTKPKKVKVTCWKAKCEDYCVPCPSHRDGRYVKCVDCCGDSTKACGQDSSDQHAGGKADDSCGPGCLKKVTGWCWRPGCAKVHTKKKLLKKEKEVELCGVNEYKWEVVDLCGGCKDKSEAAAPPVDASAEVPPPPRVEAHMIHGKPVVDRMAGLSR
jgi:hypothetical protein